ncbi:cell wall-binding repeat-containing protein [Phycicoccus sp. SLBN-51]|uniref:cell wall-binding repeat-containing protein n=1 Tax=Phycicoccus sp. SLBN-51 TaxID=2768447 RepID=UPI00256FEE90|nr:cell wall-binding repeat-containing protein [Phycicoccus sp. SLBN-51]
MLATVASVVAPLALVAAPASAAPASPALSQPAQSASSQTNPVLGWNRVTGAVRYTVQVSNRSDFASGSVVFNQSVANTYATPSSDLAAGQYWWRVAAVDSSNASSAFSTRTFTKVTANAPVPRTPSNGATLTYPSQPLILSWDALPGAKTYEVQIDDDSAFVGAPAPVTTNNNSYTPLNPPLGTTYYWRVRGKSAQGVPTQYSVPQSYTMTWPAKVSSAPGDRSPANTSTSTVEEIVLDWKPLAGASAYELQISPDEFFNAPIGGTRTVNSTSFSPSPSLPAGSYYWRVRGLNTSQVAEPSPWSDVWVFTRAWPASDPTTRPRGTEATNVFAQVQLLSPTDADYTTMREPVFSWKPQREAAMYEFNVGTDANFSPGTYSTCYTNHTVVSPYVRVKPDTIKLCNPAKLGPGGVYYWRVRAVDDITEYTPNPKTLGVFSEVRSFLYDPAFVTTIAPADGGTVDVPVLRWEAVDNISRYKVTISPVTAVTGCISVSAETYNTTYVPETLSDKCTGEMRWTVQSVEDDGQMSRLAQVASWPRFTINPPAPQSSMGLVNMTSFDSARPPLMQWSPLTNATSYRVFISLAGANSFVAANKSTNRAAFAYTGKDTTLANVLAPGSYDFYVEAYNGTAVLDQTAVRSFTVSGWPTAAITGPKCADGVVCTLHDTPTLDWEPIANVGLYRVYLATDPNFTNIVREWNTTFSELTPVESLPDSQAGESYYWYVRPCYTGTSCAPFDTSVFPNAGVFRKVSQPVEAIAPKMTSSTPPVVADEVTFTWKDYLATNAPLDGTTPSGSLVPETVTQEARAYEVQVSTTAEFTNIIETSPRIDQTTYTAQTKTYPDGPLFWRVRAYDASDNPLTYSCAPGTTAKAPQPACSQFEFQKKSAAPTQVAPVNGSSVSSAPVMTWQAMPYAKTYQIEVYSSPSSPLNPANRVVSLTSRGAASSALTALSKGDYGWRVRRVDVNGLPGAWTTESNTGLYRFTVAGPAVTLSVPTAGATLAADHVLMQWTSAPGASRYRVDVTQDGFATVKETVTTDMTSWAPYLYYTKWPAGTYAWRVTTLDANGQALAVSATRGFSIGGTTTTPTPTPGTVERWAGSDRYATSAAISAKSFKAGVPIAYIASGMNFPDALSGAPIAGKNRGPVLLTSPTSLPSVIATELSRLKPQKIVILGGTGAVSDLVRTKLKSYTTGTVDRWAGSDRYASSAVFSAKSFPSGVSVAYVASGLNFPDALSGAPVAGKTPGPVLLTAPTSLPSPIATELKRLAPKKIVVLGGTGAVSDAVKNKLAYYTSGTVVRWSGSDRFASSATFSAKSYPAGVGVAYIANGFNFPDALSGAPVAGMTGGPVLLTSATSLPSVIATELKRLKPKKIVVLGGTGAVSSSVQTQLKSYLG